MFHDWLAIVLSPVLGWLNKVVARVLQRCLPSDVLLKSPGADMALGLVSFIVCANKGRLGMNSTLLIMIVFSLSLHAEPYLLQIERFEHVIRSFQHLVAMRLILSNKFVMLEVQSTAILIITVDACTELDP